MKGTKPDLKYIFVNATWILLVITSFLIGSGNTDYLNYLIILSAELIIAAICWTKHRKNLSTTQTVKNSKTKTPKKRKTKMTTDYPAP